MIRPFSERDREAWEALARGYKIFYATETSAWEFEAAWRRLAARDRVHGLGAEVDGRLVGIAHYLFHASAWTDKVCYLQDLFVAPEHRGRGLARKLIDAVAREARIQGASRYYWMTQEDNAAGRALYDKVARYNGFIRYDYPLSL